MWHGGRYGAVGIGHNGGHARHSQGEQDMNEEQRDLTPARGVVEWHPRARAHAHGHHLAPQQQPLHQHPEEGDQKEKVHHSCDGHAGHLDGRVGDPH